MIYHEARMTSLIRSDHDVRSPDGSDPPAPPRPDPPRPPRHPGFRGRLAQVVPPLAVVVVVLALWQLIVSVRHVDPQLLPGPWVIVQSTWNDRVNIWPAIGVTTEEAVLGVLVAIVVAVVVAVAIDSFRSVRAASPPHRRLPDRSDHRPGAIGTGVVGVRPAPQGGAGGAVQLIPISVGLIQGMASADPDATTFCAPCGPTASSC